MTAPAKDAWFAPNCLAAGPSMIVGHKAASECHRVWRKEYCFVPAFLPFSIARFPFEPPDYFAERVFPSGVCRTRELGLLHWRGRGSDHQSRGMKEDSSLAREMENG